MKRKTIITRITAIGLAAIMLLGGWDLPGMADPGIHKAQTGVAQPRKQVGKTDRSP